MYELVISGYIFLITLGLSAPVIYFVYEIGRIVNILKRIDDNVHEIKHKAVRIDRNINRIDDNVRKIKFKIK